MQNLAGPEAFVSVSAKTVTGVTKSMRLTEQRVMLGAVRWLSFDRLKQVFSQVSLSANSQSTLNRFARRLFTDFEAQIAQKFYFGVCEYPMSGLRFA